MEFPSGTFVSGPYFKDSRLHITHLLWAVRFVGVEGVWFVGVADLHRG